MIDPNLPVFGAAEDLLLGIFREYFQGKDVTVTSEFSEGLALPAVVARADRRSGTTSFQTKDARFLRPVIISVSTIASGADADLLASQLSEATKLALLQAQLTQQVVPNAGYISYIENSTPPTRVSDWQTSTAVVQYASLPKGATRYEAVYRLMIRPPEQITINNPFVASQ